MFATALGVVAGAGVVSPAQATNSAPATKLEATHGLSVEEMVVLEGGRPVGKVVPGKRYTLRVLVRNTTNEDDDRGFYYEDVQVRVIPKSPGTVFYRDKRFRKTATRFNSPFTELVPGANHSFTIPFMFHGAAIPTKDLRFSVGLYGERIPAVSGWNTLRPSI